MPTCAALRFCSRYVMMGPLAPPLGGDRRNLQHLPSKRKCSITHTERRHQQHQTKQSQLNLCFCRGLVAGDARRPGQWIPQLHRNASTTTPNKYIANSFLAPSADSSHSPDFATWGLQQAVLQSVPCKVPRRPACCKSSQQRERPNEVLGMSLSTWRSCSIVSITHRRQKAS